MLKHFRADDIDDYETEMRPQRAEKIVLPPAPRASLGPNISDDRIPREPPFTAYIANLSYDIIEQDVYDFFNKLNVTKIRLLREGDPENGRLKGYGYADFGDRQSLIDALAMCDQSLKDRKIRIDISTNSTMHGGNDRDRRGGYNRMDNRRQDDDGEDRTAGDWRSGGGPPAFRSDDRYEAPRDRGYDRRDGGGGFRDDRRSNDRGNGNCLKLYVDKRIAILI